MKTRRSTVFPVLLLAALFCAPAAHAEEKKDTGKAAPAAAATEKPKTPQQEKMAKCNKQAKEKNIGGPDRNAFMSTCLKG